MLTLVTGGSASGKSEYAESLVLSLPGGQARIYLATMEPFGEEAQERIARHRAMRRGRGFVTVECPRDLEKIRVSSAPMCRARACPRDPEKTLLPSGSSILLEDLGNLVANELFGGPEKERPQGERTDDGALISRILQGIRRLHDACEHLTIVTDEVFSGGQEYAGDTLRYLQVLARVNRELAGRADQVIEVVCGIPVFLRKERNLSDKQNLCDK
ncbi:MAG: bifunctional adenosylcobinamide kinase/adenosylcobinamide-phosphate guanylyltransferase, partial [Eubacteriales bacterium]|nr:bifunctional adenosylcobinamide kinase/adenosylcobinamide-phosphate guanylyltransferase [Eubacteriales bacterium]